MPYSTGYHAPFAWISSRPVSWLTRNATGWQSRSLQQGMPLGDRSPAYHSCDSAGSADAAVATSMTLRATDKSIPDLQKCAPRSSENRSGLGLRPTRPPGLFFSRLWLRSWWPLVCPDPTSLSTPIGTSGRRTPNRKSDDNARAKCGTGECRQDQNHAPPPRCEETENPQMPRALPIDMRCQSDASSLASQIVTSKICPVRAGIGPCSAATGQICVRPGLTKDASA